MEIARTPQGKKVAQHGVAWQVVPADENGTAQRNVRDPSVYLFVNEENETGNLILGLCFPMAPPAANGPPLGPGESEKNGEGQAATGLRASWAPATAGPTSWASKLGTTQLPRSAAPVIL